MLPPVISINTNGAEKSKKLKSSIRSSGKKSKIRNWVFRKIFSEDDAYADGEYEKNENPDETIDTTTTTNKPNLERENWSGKFDVGVANNIFFTFVIFSLNLLKF